MNLPLGGTQKLTKPFSNNQPSKLFAKCNSSQYNSQKNLRNTGALGNNRYSSQNMKSFEYDDENDMDEEFGLEVAEEKLPIYNNLQTNQRRTSQRFKDRVRSIRVQSQETCAREGNPGLCKSEGSNDPFEVFERAPIESQEMIYGQNKRKSNLININQCEVDYSQGRGWTQPISVDEEETPKLEDQYDEMSGAHFQFNELLNKLKEIKKVKREKLSSKGAKQSLNRVSQNETQDFQREPLKEKNVESVNQQQNLLSDFKKKKSLDNKQRKGGLSNTGNGKTTQKHGLKLSQSKPTPQQNDKNKLSKLILTNQENNFIEKKLKDQGGKEEKQTQKRLSNKAQNKSHASLHKSGDKNASKSSHSNQGCVINNMKVKPQQHPPTESNTHKQSFISQGSKGAQKIPQIPQLNTNINNNMSNNMMQTKLGNMGAGIKCPSANVLKTGNTAISSNRKSTMMTQSSSNKQFQTRDTPETTQRQKVRLGVGTSHSSNSKFAAATTSSGSNNGANTYIPSNFQTVTAQHESLTKRSQNSDSKHSKHESLGNRSNSNTTQKTEIKKMMIKNQNIIKQNQKKISNSNLFVPPSQVINHKKETESNLEKKKNSITGGSARVAKVHHKVNPQRFSGQGSNHVSVNSPGTMDLKSIESSPNQSWTRRSSINSKDPNTHKNQPNNPQNPMSMYQVNQILRKLQDQTQPLVKSQKPGANQQSILLSHQLKKHTMNQVNKQGNKTSKQHNETYLNRNNSQEYMFKNFQISGKNSDNQLIKTLEIDKKLLQEQVGEERQQLQKLPLNMQEKKADLMGKFLIQKKQEMNQNNHKIFKNQAQMNNGQKKGLLIQNIMMQNGMKTKTRQSDKVYMATQENINDQMINIGEIMKFTSLMQEEESNIHHKIEDAAPQSGQRLSQRVKNTNQKSETSSTYYREENRDEIKELDDIYLKMASEIRNQNSDQQQVTQSPFFSPNINQFDIGISENQTKLSNQLSGSGQEEINLSQTQYCDSKCIQIQEANKRSATKNRYHQAKDEERLRDSQVLPLQSADTPSESVLRDLQNKENLQTHNNTTINPQLRNSNNQRFNLRSTQKQLKFDIDHQVFLQSSFLSQNERYMELLKTKTELEEQLQNDHKEVETMQSEIKKYQKRAMEAEGQVQLLQKQLHDVKDKSKSQAATLESTQKLKQSTKENNLLKERVKTLEGELKKKNIQISQLEKTIKESTQIENYATSQAHLHYVTNENIKLNKELIEYKVREDIKKDEMDMKKKHYQDQLQMYEDLLQFQTQKTSQVIRDRIIFTVIQIVLLMFVFFMMADTLKDFNFWENPITIFLTHLVGEIKNFAMQQMSQYL